MEAYIYAYVYIYVNIPFTTHFNPEHAGSILNVALQLLNYTLQQSRKPQSFVLNFHSKIKLTYLLTYLLTHSMVQDII
jgi:hypothetical protein